MIVEQSVVPRAGDEPCADRLISGAHVVGVADGATKKPWDTGPDGAALAEAVAGHLAGLPARCSAREAAGSATALVRGLLPEPGAGSAVTFCVLHRPRREIWRVGEGRVLLDATPVPPRPSGERVVAEARALVLRAHLADGVPEAALLADDPGRAAVRELLRALVGLRNRPDPHLGYGAIDGRDVPAGFVEVLPVPEGVREVVITTDGYPEPAPTLAEAERLLAERLARDPLMIEDPPETKGLRPAANSFDDRAYLRVRL
ncbi:hypothetical protein SAMN05421837_107302 [Amycolatopsis pretoriensis]|uniref:Protein phosphatase 2C n=1 Tax=Amycolatopsis pretoriensis TaxID=218821 RepID=A0A1H5R775_9PSEU|nr:hypothetical protein [Amycolatopsis pretoriensis]SEF34280.1 hypothetical protein SAMN05421837_107302 [Amycolatopsis pretoriensis]